jgi:biopolymer transport protein ExbD
MRNPFKLEAWIMVLLPIVVVLIGFITAVIVPRLRFQSALSAETQTEPVRLEAGDSGLCHVLYQRVDRKAPCKEIVALMRSDLHIPTQGHLVLRASKGVTYEEISGLLQSLRDAGYDLKVGYVSSQ